MDSHAVQSHVEGEEEDHHEKKSVLKKVKAKAKQLKETITGHHHGHDQEGHHSPDDHDLEEEDDVDFDNPEVHGAPIRRTDAPVQGDILKAPMRSFGDTRVGRDEYDPIVPRDRTNANVSDPMRSNVPGLHGTQEHDAMTTSGTTRKTDAPVQGGIHSGATHHEHDSAVPGGRINVGYSGPVSAFVSGGQNRTGHEDLLGGAKSKLVVSTTGPVLKHEEPKGTFDAIGRGTHTPLNTPVSSLPHDGQYNSNAMDVDSDKTSGSRQVGNLGQTGDSLGKTDVLCEDTPLPHRNSGTYKSTMDVVPSTKSVAGGGEIGATPVHSFDKMNLHGDDRQYLNDGGNQSQSTGSHEQFTPEKPLNQGTSYTEKISSATSAIAGKAISAKNTVASKLGYGGTETEHDDYSRGYVTGAGKSGSSPSQHQNQVLDPSTNQSKPAETPQVRGTMEPEHNTATDLKPSNQTGRTYTEKISSATSAIAGKAISAKNVVASKLGYGPSDQVHEGGDATLTKVPSGTTAADQHGKMITSTVAEKLTPVYEKVAGAGTAVISKIPGVSSASTSRDTSAGPVGQAGQNKRVSVKDYVAEKLRPGEEDRALSEVISAKLQKQKPGVKEQAGHSAEEARPMGKVTESEEVRQRLGSDGGNENFLVEKIEASVGSMLGGAKSDEAQRGFSNRSAATGNEHRRLQEI